MAEQSLRSVAITLSTQQASFDGKRVSFFTEVDSPKIAEIRRHPKVNLAYASRRKNTYASPAGDAHVSRDQGRIDQKFINRMTRPPSGIRFRPSAEAFCLGAGSFHPAAGSWKAVIGPGNGRRPALRCSAVRWSVSLPRPATALLRRLQVVGGFATHREVRGTGRGARGLDPHADRRGVEQVQSLRLAQVPAGGEADSDLAMRAGGAHQQAVAVEGYRRAVDARDAAFDDDLPAVAQRPGVRCGAAARDGNERAQHGRYPPANDALCP